MNPLFFYACVFSVLAFFSIELIDRKNKLNSQCITRGVLLMLLLMPAILILPKWHVLTAPAGVFRMIEAVEQSTPLWLWIFWIIGAMVCVIRLATSLWQLHSWKKKSAMITAEPMLEMARNCCQKLNHQRDIELRELKDHKGPAACGIFRRTVYLPCDWRCWTKETSRAVLLHEIGHHVSNDPLWRMISLLCTSLHWYNPFICWLSSKQHQQSELACDDRVIRSGFHRDDYANILCDLASHAPSSALAMASPGGLEARVRQLGKNRKRLDSLWLYALMIVLLLVALVLSILRPLRDPGTPFPPTPEDTNLRLQADPFPAD